jgi:hypothetical protein
VLCLIGYTAVTDSEIQITLRVKSDAPSVMDAGFAVINGIGLVDHLLVLPFPLVDFSPHDRGKSQGIPVSADDRMTEGQINPAIGLIIRVRHYVQ